MSLRGRLERIYASSFRSKNLFYFFILFFLYLAITTTINKFYIILPGLLHNNLWITIPFITLNILIAILFAITINLSIYRYKESKKIRKHAGLAPVGVFLGVLGGMCPGCFAGLFPTFFALFGITTTLTIFPLFGAELLLLALILMGLSIWFLSNDQTMCTIQPKKKK